MKRNHKLMRRSFLMTTGAAAAMAFVSCAAPPPGASTPAEPPTKDPDEALRRLQDGNKRFAANMAKNPNHADSRRMMVASGQTPFATIFSCVDSRVPPEIVFDRGLGDLFVIRTAGHVIDDAVLGSIEFGVAELGIPLVVVMGHERCGAVKATIEAIENRSAASAQIGTLVEGIKPAVEKAHEQGGDLLDNAVRANTMLTVEQLTNAPILSEALAKGQIKVVGARYDLDTGAIEFFG